MGGGMGPGWGGGSRGELGHIQGKTSGIARTFPGGRAAHPEDQNEEENEENLRKHERTYMKMRID